MKERSKFTVGTLTNCSDSKKDTNNVKRIIPVLTNGSEAFSSLNLLPAKKGGNALGKTNKMASQ